MTINRQIILGVTYKYFDYNSELTSDKEGDASGHSTDIGSTSTCTAARAG